MVGTVGLVAAGVTALAAGIAALVIIKWDTISAGLSQLVRVLATLGNIMKPWSPPSPSPGDSGSASKPETPKSWMWQPGSFIAPQNKTENHYHNTALNIDGERIASIVEQRISQMHEMPDAASSSNGVAYNNLNDWNPRDS